MAAIREVIVRRPSVTELYARCDEVGECLLWTGTVGQHVPQFYVRNRPDGGRNKHGAYLSCRREVYESSSGKPIQDGRFPVPMCRDRRCIRYEHLKLLTRKQIGQLASKEGKFSAPQRAAAIREGIRKAGRLKLTPEQVREIRTSDETGVALAARMGVDKSLPPRIRRNEAHRETVANASVFNMRA